MTNQNVVPSEVGWQFVPQYYTFVNKQPNRLHCFYTKASTFIHGNEGEDGKPCYGQQEIHNKITSIGFKDCKVFIHSVDAQSSASGGIIIQVIGEMANDGGPWRKFVQTFFLAEQPNGYFVLNDIFRFLKEDSPESDDASDAAEHDTVPAPVANAAAAPASPAPAPAQNLAPAPEPTREPSPQPPVTQPAASPAPLAAEELPTTDIPEPVAPAPEPVQSQPPVAPAATTPVASTVTSSQPNGVHTPAPVAAEPEKAATPAPSAAPTSTSAPEKSNAPTPAPAPAVPAPIAAAPTPPPAAPPATTQKPSTPAPAPAAPSAPKSWATLAATNSNKWGAAVAQESKGVTESPAASSPASGTQTPSGRGQQQQHHQHHSQQQQQQQQQQHHHHHHQPQQQRDGSQQGQGQGQGYNAGAPRDIQSAHCFVKGVTEPISQTLLTNTLTQRFGPIKELDIIRTKACAFLEFATLEAARKAINASPIHIDVGGDAGTLRISIETKKERGDRPTGGGRARGGGAGSPANGPTGGASGGAGSGSGGGHGHSHGHGDGQGGRGGYRGRGGASRGGRGTPAGK